MSKPHIPLPAIEAQVAQCRRCPLCDGRTQTVFGVGNPEARVLFIGEAPGKNEDLQGEPFVGAAGKYLNELLAIAGLTRDEVYIANVLKCRPPGNRNPRPEEIEVCAPFLREQTRTIDPEFIVTLGNFATKFVPSIPVPRNQFRVLLPYSQMITSSSMGSSADANAMQDSAITSVIRNAKNLFMCSPSMYFVRSVPAASV